jgi:hypothetical protein
MRTEGRRRPVKFLVWGILVIGIGMVAKAADTPLTISTSSIDFGRVHIGGTSTVSVTLTNSGPASFGPINIIGGGTQIVEFKLSQNCWGSILQAGKSCDVSYSFSPTVPGTFNAVSSFSVSETPNPGDSEGFSVSLAGVGVSSMITASPISHNFGNVAVGTTSPNLATVITNTGAQSFGPINMFSGVMYGGPFASTQNCQGATLPPGGTCSIVHTFSPTAPGVVNDFLALTVTPTPSPADGTYFVISLSGCGASDGSACPPPESVALVIPAAGSTPGNFGSFFRTGVQLSNSTAEMITGRFVYHPAGVSGSSTDPSLSFTVPPRSTVSYDDVVQTMGQSGLGSLDVVAPSGASVPVVVARVYNDAGAAGTSGFTEEAIYVTGDEHLLTSASIALLVAPPNNDSLRFNIGVRTMEVGAFLSFRIFDANGSLIRTVTKSYGPNFFEQEPAEAFLGAPLPPGASIEVTVGGSAIIYGATVDNVTNDPSIQYARLVSFVA